MFLSRFGIIHFAYVVLRITSSRFPIRTSPVSPHRAVNLQPALPSRRRIIRIVDRITKSSYFQKAVDTKLVQRGMERLSNTPIVLQVEVGANILL
ncbi:unnamed protein product [Trichobilharzia regenti]|nr:unnamed protein product [Trichobilharzia regenti]